MNSDSSDLLVEATTSQPRLPLVPHKATHDSYNDAIDMLLNGCPCPQMTSVVFATHNQVTP